jgi:hypothetical protein
MRSQSGLNRGHLEDIGKVILLALSEAITLEHGMSDAPQKALINRNAAWVLSNALHEKLAQGNCSIKQRVALGDGNVVDHLPRILRPC